MYLNKRSRFLLIFFKKIRGSNNVKRIFRTSLVVQWLRICLLMKGTQVQPLVLEDLMYHGAAKSVCPSTEACMHEGWCSTAREASAMRSTAAGD